MIAKLAPFKPVCIKKILIIKLDHIGDHVLAMPAIRLLRRHFEGVKLVGLIGEWSKQIAEKNNLYDEIITYNLFQETRASAPVYDKNKERELANLLKQYQFDIAIDFRRQPESRGFLELSGAKIKVGYTTRTEIDGILDIKIDSYPDKAGEKNIHNTTSSAIQMLELAMKLTKSFIPVKSILTNIDEKEKDEARKILEKFGVKLSEQYIIGIHPGATHPAKQWGDKNFSSLIEILQARIKASFLIFGSKDDAILCNNIKSKIEKQNVFNLAGKLTLEDFIKVSSILNIIIGNDNGAMHLASSTGIPAVTIFGGREIPMEWTSLNINSIAVFKEMFCSPCHLDDVTECKYEYECIKSIKLYEVVSAVEHLLKTETDLKEFNFLQLRPEDKIIELIPNDIPEPKIKRPTHKMRIVIASAGIVQDDAIGNDCVGEYSVLKEKGYEVYLYGENVDSIFNDMMLKDRGIFDDRNAVLIYHHGIEWENGIKLVDNFKGKVILKYHNVTPPSFFKNYSREFEKSTERGREQTKYIVKSNKFALMLCDSFYNSEDLVSYGADMKKIEIVPPFHKVQKFSMLPAKQEVTKKFLDGMVNILFVGRIAPNKGIHHLIRVAYCYKNLFDNKFRLIIVGGLDPRLSRYYHEIQRDIYRDGLERNVIFTNRVDARTLKSIYLVSHVFLLMSEHEGFCVPILESQSFRVPLVAYKAGAVPETLGSEQLLYDTLDYELFASAINTLYTDFQIRIFLAEKGFENFNRFTYEKIAARFFKAIGNCL